MKLIPVSMIIRAENGYCTDTQSIIYINPKLVLYITPCGDSKESMLYMANGDGLIIAETAKNLQEIVNGCNKASEIIKDLKA